MEVLVNGLAGWVVTDDSAPSFSVRLENSEHLDALRVVVTYDRGRVYWDSGMQVFAGPSVRYEGELLAPKTPYEVTVIGYLGGVAVGQCHARFETGFMGSPWQAQWIEPEQEPAVREREIELPDLFGTADGERGAHDRLRPCRELRKTFVCKERPRRARLYATAHGVYEIYLNGRAVNGHGTGRGLLAPETSSYQGRLYYQTYDVTSLLVRGDNELLVTLADGWWIGRIGLSGDSCQYGDRLGFLMQLEWVDEAGGSGRVCSDATFTSRRSFIDYADLFIGERHDLLCPPAPWRPVTVASYSTDNLVAQPIGPLVEWERVEPDRIFRASNGDLIADFGKCLAGVVELTVDVAEPAQVVLEHSEVLDAQGNFFFNIMGRNKDQRDEFVCGRGQTTFRPRFTYHGFRYVRITGVTVEQIVSIRACAIGTELSTTGYFACSDWRLNALQRNITQSARSNMVSVPTDCPTREKMGWTGDVVAFVKTGCFNYDLHNFLSNWLCNVRLEQRPDGEIPNVVPTYPAQDRMQRAFWGDNTSSGWGDACILVPWYLYWYYGDKRVLWENLAMMEKWLGFIADSAARKPDGVDRLTPEQQARNPYLWTKGHHFGDWLIPSLAKDAEGVLKGVAVTGEVVGACHYAVTVRAFLWVLDALLEDKPLPELREKRDYYQELLQKIKRAVREEFVTDDGLVKGDLMGLYVMALYADIVEGELKKRVVQRLVDLIQRKGYRLDTGFVSTPHLLDVLTEAGHKDVAYRLLFQSESPSWLYMVEKGATSIWEDWEAVKPDGTVTRSSFNHYALGSVGDWIYRHIGGVAIGAPGYRHIVFAPDVECGLEYSVCAVQTPYGQVSCSWGRQHGRFALEVVVPLRVTAELRWNGQAHQLSGGTHRFLLDAPRTEGCVFK